MNKTVLTGMAALLAFTVLTACAPVQTGAASAATNAPSTAAQSTTAAQTTAAAQPTTAALPTTAAQATTAVQTSAVQAVTNTSGAYFQDVKDYFNMNNRVKIYNGYAETGHTILFLSFTEGEQEITVKYQGEMSDGYGTDERGARLFYVSYLVDGDSVTEQVDNRDYMSRRDDVLTSIIPGFVVLEGKVEVANAWSQEFALNGHTYTAVTTIVEATTEGFTTETVVKNIEDYPNGTYREERTYEKGKGLTSFGNSLSGEEQEPGALYGYGYSGELDPKTGLLSN